MAIDNDVENTSNVSTRIEILLAKLKEEGWSSTDGSFTEKKPIAFPPGTVTVKLPKNQTEAYNGPHAEIWKQAEVAELEGLEAMGTFESSLCTNSNWVRITNLWELRLG